MLREVRSVIIDIATSAIPNAAEFIDQESIKAPKNYVDPVKIEAYKTETMAERLSTAALDLDLGRITGIGIQAVSSMTEPYVLVCKTEDDERTVLTSLASGQLKHADYRLITFNGLSFDLPMLMRRARYLGVSSFPTLNIDKYKSGNVDLLALLSGHDPSRRRSLQFYARRLGMGLTKPLSGAEEAQVPSTGRWDDLKASLEHDCEAIHRLAKWLGIV